MNFFVVSKVIDIFIFGMFAPLIEQEIGIKNVWPKIPVINVFNNFHYYSVFYCQKIYHNDIKIMTSKLITFISKTSSDIFGQLLYGGTTTK